MALQIFYDDNHEGNWFQSLCVSLSNVPVNPIRPRGENPPFIEKLLRYDRPDIILVEDEVPKLILEKTREVPTGHNVGQRFGRLVNAAEEGVIVIFFLPFIARKHGKHSSVCSSPARLFTALQRIEMIHQVPVLAINWPSDSSYELIRDNSESALVAQLINELIINKFDYSRCSKIDEIRNLMTERIQKCIKSTAEPPPSVKIENTETYFTMLEKNFPSDYMLVQSTIRSRPLSVIYEIGMTEQNCRRTDPYTGTQFIYDYLLCRHGKNTSDKHSNLILSMPHISKAVWTKANQNRSSSKSALWYATADLIVLKDGIILCVSNIGHK